MDTRTHSVLLETARELSAQTRANDDAAPWTAVVTVAGASCEAAVADAFRRLSERTGNADARDLRRLLASRKPLTLQPKQQRAVWRALTGDRLSRWDGWVRYVRHVDRCRALTHTGRLRSGRLPDKRDAHDSLEIAEAFHAHVARVIARGDGNTSMQ
jgi:hypothetical protein